MSHKIVVIQGHPDRSRPHLCHALADAYADAAIKAGHEVVRIEIARLDFELLRTAEDFNSGSVPEALKPASDAIVAADHLVLVFPLWLGSAPALVKAFLEQVMRPGIAFVYQKHGAKKLLTGRSVHLVVTMGMPAWLYRMFYLSHGVSWLRRNVFNFVGFSPVRTTLFGSLENASEATRSRWLAAMRRDGASAR